MRAGWFKVGAVAAVLGLAAVGYLVLGSTTGDRHGSASHTEKSASALAGQIETVRDALSGVGRTIILRTERCPTQSAIGGHVRPPAQVSVRIPAESDADLVAYAAASGALLPAPMRWECTAAEGDDGTESIGTGPIGSVRVGIDSGIPELRGHGSAVRATLLPGCEGCIASVICSFFPSSNIVKAYEHFLHCPAEPAGEKRYRLSSSTFFYIDPPGVRGSAAGSGGSLPSMGVLSFTPITGVRQLSCTLAASESDRCAAIIAAFIEFARER